MPVDIAAIQHFLASPTSLTTSGFPYVEESAFRHFQDNIPYLLGSGQELLNYLVGFEPSSTDELRAKKVLQTMIYTAAITAPTDLWLLKHILSSYQQLGILDELTKEAINARDLALEHSLNEQLLTFDFNFFVSRGYLNTHDNRTYTASRHQAAQDALTNFTPYPPNIPIDIIEILCTLIKRHNPAAQSPLNKVFALPDNITPTNKGWIPGSFEIEVGSRLVPIVLALRILGISKDCEVHSVLKLPNPKAQETIFPTLKAAAVIDHQNRVTLLGARIFQRGPGPFGIIHAYHTYLNTHRTRLRNEPTKSWVARGANVAASQDANAKTFATANLNLDRYCAATGFSYNVFIEHAVGQGEATKQRFEVSGDGNITYIGADLEDAAIDSAIARQKQGILPSQMRFVRNADIGKPQILIDQLLTWGIPTTGSVMIVGNGFHEVRDQNNERMISIFKQYCQAGILLIFTEESGLNNADLSATGFNTYHAGFRYVHDLSGQGLRPVYDDHDPRRPLSWATCILKAGYQLLDKYTARTRTIFPYPKPHGHNPSISVTYFCVPKDLASRDD